MTDDENKPRKPASPLLSLLPENRARRAGGNARAEKPPLPEGVPASSSPLMVRDFQGRIFYWNSEAEEKYGWSHREAMGNVSHNLLHTVFPQPLEAINFQLLDTGFWKGQLIHSRADGTKVKVSSTWKLYRDNDGKLCTVLEINENFSLLDPRNSYLPPERLIASIGRYLWRHRTWWLAPIVLVSGAVLLIWLFTPHTTHGPFHF